ncbi:ankyrin repeat domain-containing protein 26-like [Mustela lutreola]|uniref:ankyrin repeat domain-containing protein 26-like n=1 Tax=Mustela lutreola TaxID=9666 RepID=UPI002797A992|nr:ankyrin repeat domain-containing protein 26-like [Mustela lutreola]
MKQELEFNFRALDMELRTVRNNFNQVAVIQLQEELANTLKKLSVSVASLEVTSYCPMNLEDEVKDLKEKLAQSRNQVDDRIAKLETVSSRNQAFIQELSSIKEIQTTCEKLEKNKKKLERQVNLRSCVEINVTQVAFQESIAQLRENNNASVRSQMELRIKELEFELSKMKSCQDFTKTELDRYKHLYLEEVTHRMSLTNELNKTSERLAETTTKLLVEKQQKQNLLDTINVRPALGLPYGRNVNNNSSLFNRNVALRENVVIRTSNSRRSSNDIDTYFTKVQQELEETITRAAKEAAAEFESGSSGETTSLESTFARHTDCDDIMKAYREYSEFLKQKDSI